MIASLVVSVLLHGDKSESSDVVSPLLSILQNNLPDFIFSSIPMQFCTLRCKQFMQILFILF